MANDRRAAPRPSLQRLVTRTALRCLSIAGSHRLFAFLLLVGTALRVVTFLAYRPALLYVDSLWYLESAANLYPSGYRPVGYPMFLHMLPLEGGLSVVPFVQHVFGLVAGGLLYALLVRLRVRTWLAALATAPLLFDAFQLLIEQSVMSEPLFELLLVIACAMLLWQRPVGLPAAGLAGIVFAIAALSRPVAVLLIVPAGLTVLFAGGRPTRAAAVLTLLALFGLPLAGYASWFHSIHGKYALTTSGGRLLYARVGPFADCSTLRVPPEERSLCLTRPLGQQPTFNDFAFGSRSPVQRLEAGRRSELAGDFAKRVIRHQPGTYAKRVLSDILRFFAPTRTNPSGSRLSFSQLWQFPAVFPIPPLERRGISGPLGQRPYEVVRRYGDTEQSRPSLVSFLRTYQRVAYTPGPLLAIALLAGLAAALGFGRARRSGLRGPAFLFAGLGTALIVVPAAVLGYHPRFQLPGLILLPAALAISITALTTESEPRLARAPDTDGPADAHGVAESRSSDLDRKHKDAEKEKQSATDRLANVDH